MKYITTREELKEAVEYLGTLPAVGLDLETNGLDPLTNDILLIALGTEEEQFVIDSCRCIPWPEEIEGILTNSNITKVIHNATFDYSFIFSETGIRLNNIYCTMLGKQLMIAGRPDVPRMPSLEYLLQVYLDITIDKETRESFVDMKLSDSFTDNQITYAADDVKYLLPLAKKLKAEIIHNSLEEVYKDEMALIPVVAEMQLRGIKLDREKWQAIYDKNSRQLKTTRTKIVKELRSKLADKCSELCGQDVSEGHVNDYLNLFTTDLYIESHDKLLAILQYLDLSVTSTAEDSLSAIKEEEFQTFATNMLKFREVEKRMSTYGVGFFKHIHEHDNRIHANFNQYVTDTSRFSSSGPNLQNIPKEQEFRACFVAEPNYSILAADYAQQEPRLIAQITGDKKLRQVFIDGRDMYEDIAVNLFESRGINIRDKEGKIKTKIRSRCKTIGLGIGYGQSHWTLARDLDMSPRELSNDLLEWLIDRGVWLYKEGKRKKVNIIFEQAKELMYTKKDNVSALSSAEREIYDTILKRWQDIEAKQFIDNYYKSYPDVLAFKNEVLEELLKTNYVRVVGGRLRYFPLPCNYDTAKRILKRADSGGFYKFTENEKELYKELLRLWREAVNTKIQCAAAGMAKKAMVLIHDSIKDDYDAYIISMIHDEILIECHKEVVDEVQPIVEHCMVEAGNQFLPDIPVIVDIKVADYWVKD